MADTSNTADSIDSRDVIARIEELYGSEGITEEESSELASLLKLAAQGESLDDWEHGAQLVRESYFTKHAQELAEDCGHMNHEVSQRWPYTCIDWEQAARELMHDYTALDYEGVTYYVR